MESILSQWGRMITRHSQNTITETKGWSGARGPVRTLYKQRVLANQTYDLPIMVTFSPSWRVCTDGPNISGFASDSESLRETFFDRSGNMIM